ncbi:MAG: hexitol phosphatase HxpB [Flavipsychrobacter sp.]|jgi:mannitol-1-/sugar-/sorbitol-6-/2-deoxyglucose-6-phosphatase|nr:hexitol phosphatase HxpB [Flavipsychrobacter sp.]
MINTVIFDMDGLLLDTEPLWGKSMLQVAEKHKIPITAQRFKETTGLRIYEVTDHWAIHYPWEGRSSKEVAEEILDEIIASSKSHATVMRGVEQTLQLLRKHKFKIGLASSSPARMIHELVDHFGITHYFDVITSADVVDLGKPHPAVFLHCAAELGSRPNQCVVLEDSVNGMIAGKAARMKVIAIPEEIHFDDPRFSIADARLRSMEDFDLDMLKHL